MCLSYFMFFSEDITLTKAKEPSLPFYLPIAGVGKRTDGFVSKSIPSVYVFFDLCPHRATISFNCLSTKLYFVIVNMLNNLKKKLIFKTVYCLKLQCSVLRRFHTYAHTHTYAHICKERVLSTKYRFTCMDNLI